MPRTILERVLLTSDECSRLWAHGDSAKFLDSWSSCGVRCCVEPRTAAKNWMLGRRTAYNDAVGLAALAAAAGIYCLASASSLGSSVASRCRSGLVEG